MTKRKNTLLTKPLERDALHLLLTDSRFYARIGHAIKPEMLPNDDARVVLTLAHAFAKDTPGGALSLSVMAQRLQRRRVEGQMTSEEVDDTFDWLEEILNDPMPDREGVISEIAAEVKRERGNEHVQKAMEVVAKHGSLKEIADSIQETEKLGKEERRRSTAWDDDNEVTRIESNTARLRTGIEGLDEVMEGGLPRAQLIYALGNTGAGKSMFLSQCAAEAFRQNECPWIATFEVDDRKWKHRLQAAASDIPLRAIREGELSPDDMQQLKHARRGRIAAIESFSASGTTAEDMFRAFDEANRKLELAGSPHRFTVLVCDYADKLTWPSHIKSNDSYNGYRYVYEALRAGAEERNIWFITASQSTRSDKRKKKKGDDLLSLQDTADSIHKARIADVGLTLNVTADRQSIRVYLEKNRDGDDHYVTDFLETAYAYGRLTARAHAAPAVPDNDNGAAYTTQDLPF